MASGAPRAPDVTVMPRARPRAEEHPPFRVGPEEYQALLNDRDDLDEEPVRLSRYRVRKCAAIITAGLADRILRQPKYRIATYKN